MWHATNWRAYKTLAILISLALPTYTIWPFTPKRFAGNAFLGAGSMGVDDNVDIIAFGDFNGDQL